MNRFKPLSGLKVECLDLGEPSVLARLSDGAGYVSDTVYMFSDEWRTRKAQCEAFLAARAGRFERRVGARACRAALVVASAARDFLEQYHVQGTNNLSLVYFGLFLESELVGLLSLGRHSRQIAQNRVVLDRLCFKAGVQVVGGASKLLKLASAWAKDRRYDEIVSFSDNRWTDGGVYRALKFRLDRAHKPDYFYVKDGVRYSKQSQKKAASGCPESLTEAQWAGLNGLTRVYEAGKKRWLLNLNPEEHQTRNELSSAKCAEQHRTGVFKHAHIRGFLTSAKNQTSVYYGSSYELRCLYLLERNSAVKAFKRCDTFEGAEGWRNPDFWVDFVDGRSEIWEVKPQAMLLHPAVKQQLAESLNFATSRGVAFRTWTEKDSGLQDEHKIVSWARTYLADSCGDATARVRHRVQRKQIRDRYYQRHIANDKVRVHCDYCNVEHEALRLTYERNVARNGKYVCERYGGYLAGKKPKPRAANPYAGQGKKMCSLCGQLLDFECFTVRRASRDGLTASCKTCAARARTSAEALASVS
jgi:hypothetical protein